MARHTALIACLTLVVSLAMTGDLIMDLVFEGPDLSTSAEGTPIQEELDNPAEHILMASQKTDGPVGNVWPAWAWVAFAALLMSACLPAISRTRAAPTYERPPRSSPIPLLLPLRI